ncbi:SDR family oxidoreductase [Micromonospora sp. WMMA1363]|uniref:SDR family oxidoreductase n=1 Tax=Micromonospora sp. WMMA1363 TaxID=3053985 RepID=UPI00259C78A2|nr:SDR family oxidoreductase [Micromonospora sp. WMMA1363]MDM4722000.1 SDR family oxidoreductase [Micromonospora sp. WMMA1363]
MSEPKRILVTGAAGLVGAEICARLLKAGHRVSGLVHTTRVLIANGGRVVASAADDRADTVRLVTGDVTVPRLGLDDDTWTDLADGLDLIVHSAAITDFGRPREAYQAINTTGTAHVLELARERSTPLVHVSTAYVCGEREGTVLESQLDVGQRFGNPYEESKLAAEQLVRKAATDSLPTVVIRPSVVVGAARTGVVRDFKNLYVVLKLLSEGRISAIPGYFDACVDLVPVDHVAALITAVVDDFARARGRTLHAVGASVRMRHISDVLAEYPSFHVPRYIAPATFDPATLPDLECGYWHRVMSLYESYFRRRQHFDDATAAEFRVHKRLPSGPNHLRRIIDYAVGAGYLGAPLQSVADALSRVNQR